MLSERPPVLLDVRWQLGSDAGASDYRAGHIPGAVFADLDADLADPPSPSAGRHPLPSLDRLQAAARRWGIDDDSPVVVYDDIGNLAAARAWWVLRWAGLTDIRLLDGGVGAWRSAGRRVSAGDTRPRPGSVTLRPGMLPTVSADDVAEISRGAAAGLLLDARAAERYRGEVEPVDPRAGHIPGAVSMPTAANIDADGRFLPVAGLRARFAAVVNGAQPVVVYCGSGVNAAHQLVALELAGYSGVLYPGSWSQWSNDPTRPAAVGVGP
ncbi:MAG: sulfurtransferase [Gordonia sp. (in: high G+C Gram-positive bacteria)]